VSLDPSPIHVHLLPALIPPGALRGGVAVVIDVLRATTAMVHALAAGCVAIVPCGEVDEARRIAASLAPGSALLGGERQGLPIEGFDLGNSPGAYTPEVCRGKTLVITTTNGTRAILASLEADRVLIAGFVNLSATVAALMADGRPVHLVCSGTEGQISLEDTLLAGELASHLDELDRNDIEDVRLNPDYARGPDLRPRGTILENDAALIAADCWFTTKELLDRLPLAESLALGRGGRRVRELGLDGDILAAAQVDRFAFAAELRRDPLRIVRVE